MWKVFVGDPLTLYMTCLTEDEVAVDVSEYTIGVNLVWGDDDDERLEFEADDLDLTDAATGVIVTRITAAQVEGLPVGNKVKVYLVLTPPGDDQFTTYIGRITVRDA